MLKNPFNSTRFQARFAPQKSASRFGTYTIQDLAMPRLTRAQIEAALQDLPGWNPTGEDLGKPEIRKQFQFADFIEAMTFVNEVAQLAEEVNHHPDIDIRYNHVLLSLWSHDQNGVTDRDIRLAREIEKIGE